MNIQQLVRTLEGRVRDAQGSEVIIPKQEIIDFIELGEEQLKGLHARLRASDREVSLLKDRIEAKKHSGGRA